MFGKCRWIPPLALALACPQASMAADSTAIPRLTQAPRLEDFEGMRPNDVAARMQRIPDFIQNFPSDGKPGTERSEGFLGYDQTNLYIVLLCWDHEHGVRANLTRREPPTTNHDGRPFDSDDFIEVTLDTFQDQRHGFVFDVNPKGVQADAFEFLHEHLWLLGGGQYSFRL